MKPIGLIAAMRQESDALLRYINDSKPIQVGPFHGRSFELAGQNCVLVTSGMGIRRASEAAQTLIQVVSPRGLISFGIAGGVENELAIGDVIAAEKVCRLEQGVPTPPLPLEPWSSAARESVTRTITGRGARLFVGTAVTTNGSQVNAGQLRRIMHPILEMETAGIALVAAEKGIPLLSIRAISDGPRAPLPIDLGEIMDEDANLRPGKMLMAVLRDPGMILRVGGLMRNVRIAADNAAMVVIMVLRNRSAVEG
jgi:adenosylhomocysteine nucleosidase